MRHYTSENIRQAIIRMSDDMSEREIAKELQISPSTVHYWIQKIHSGKDFRTSPKSGRPRITDSETDEFILRTSKENPFLPATDIREILTINECTVQTIRNRLREGGLRSRIPARKPRLTANHKQKRLTFALNHYHWTYEQSWSRVIFSDEKVFRSSGHGPPRVWRPVDSNRFDEQYMKFPQNLKRFSIPVWVGFCVSANMYVIHYIKDKTLKSKYYVNRILKPLIPILNLWNNDLIFMQDRSPIHTSKKTQKFLKSRRIEWMEDWPPKGPDMNPVENVWAEMERRLPDRLPKNKDELWDMVQGTFESLEVEYFKSLVESMPDRMAVVASKFGGWSKY